MGVTLSLWGRKPHISPQSGYWGCSSQVLRISEAIVDNKLVLHDCAVITWCWFSMPEDIFSLDLFFSTPLMLSRWCSQDGQSISHPA